MKNKNEYPKKQVNDQIFNSSKFEYQNLKGKTLLHNAKYYTTPFNDKLDDDTKDLVGKNNEQE